MKETLDLAKKGMILTATNDDPLKSVFNSLDMQRMVEVGAII